MADDNKTVSVDEHSRVVQELERERDRARRFEAEIVDVKKQLEPFKKVDLERLRAAAEELENVKREKASGDPDKVKQLVEDGKKELRLEWQKEREEHQGRIKALEAENKELKIVDKAMAEIGGEINEDMHPFIKQYVRSFVDIGDNGFVVRDDKGEVRYSKLDHAKPMGLREYSEELAERHPSAFKARSVSGGMTPGQKSNGQSRGLDVSRFIRMNPDEQNAIPVKERGELAMAALKNIKI